MSDEKKKTNMQFGSTAYVATRKPALDYCILTSVDGKAIAPFGFYAHSSVRAAQQGAALDFQSIHAHCSHKERMLLRSDTSHNLVRG